jgi:hypothetical protein
MERNNIVDIYLDSIKLVESGAKVLILKKCEYENKIIITHESLQFLLLFYNYLVYNYTNDIVSTIKLKNRNKIVLYVKK